MYVHDDAPGEPAQPDCDSDEALLVLDDDPRIRRMLNRVFAPHFREVLLAGTPAEAGVLLEQHRVTHIVTDYDLGSEHPRGTELVIEWRRRFPSIRTVLLYSGTPVSKSALPKEVDRVFLKGDTPVAMVWALKA